MKILKSSALPELALVKITLRNLSLVAVLGVTEVSRCASFYNRAVGAYPVPALQLLPENVYFKKTTHEVFVSPTVR